MRIFSRTTRAALIAAITGVVIAYGAQPAAAAPGQKVGVAFNNVREVPAFIQRTGVRPDYVDLYVGWGYKQPFDTFSASTLRRWGIQYKATWEPWTAGAGVNQPNYQLIDIIQGRHDAYIVQWARGAAAFRHPVTVRFMHEGNGNWYPWSPGVNGNTAAQYRAAWQRVHTLVRRAGATNVRWEWAPNQLYSSSSSLRAIYPGDAYVSQVGMSAYNWGTTNPWNRWTEYPALWSPTIRDIRTFTQRPIGVAETGSVEGPGSKPAWLGRMFDHTRATRMPFVTYFNVNNHQAAWRVDTIPANAAAFKAGHARLKAL